MYPNYIDSCVLKKIIETYRPIKQQSEYTKISLFKEPRNIERDSKKIRIKRRGISPDYWNTDQIEIAQIKSRSRLDDFTHDSVSHLFPRKSPEFNKTKSTKLPPLQFDEKIYNRKIDNTTLYREAIFKLQKQGFFSTKS